MNNGTFCECLRRHMKKHPSVQPQDIVKFCYQAAFGAEHLLADLDAAKSYFDSEYESVQTNVDELYEELSEDICRVNFAAWKASGMPAEWLFNMFVRSVKESYGRDELFAEYLHAAECVLRENKAAFSSDDWQQYLKKYKEMGMPAVHHSETYRKQENPSYRIVDKKFLQVLPILQRAALLAEKQGVKVIAIDGRAASGKTTMTELLQRVLDAGVVHMDDFFLPPELRSEERLCEPGGNVHYERFEEEVLPFIAKEDAFSYRIFDCSKMKIDGMRQVKKTPWRIVEGSYSHHPKFAEYAELKVFLTVDSKTQLERIALRNGAEMRTVFEEKWIPMEESYFQAHKVMECSNLVVTL